MAFVIAEPCIAVRDGSCLDVCPVDCIYDGGDLLVIHPDECIDCAACVPECPVEAIYPSGELPDRWASFAPLNADAAAKRLPPPELLQR